MLTFDLVTAEMPYYLMAEGLDCNSPHIKAVPTAGHLVS